MGSSEIDQTIPASERPVHVSIIVPVHNNAMDLAECVGALAAESRPEDEILIVDDGSTDGTPAAAARLGGRVLTLGKNSGPAAARNHGARHARGELLFFVDADVVIARGMLDRIRSVFAERDDVAAVFGSYDATPRAAGDVSRYRNLLHHFVHQNGDVVASTFWAGCGAIRRDVFDKIGGFDEQRFRRPSIEDIELGHRLSRAGYRILLDKGLQGTHLKRWSLVSMIRTDITQRAMPWARLTIDAEGIPDTLNLRWDQRLSAALVAVGAVSLLFAAAKVQLIVLAVAAFAVAFVINRHLYRFFFRRGGVRFATVCVGLHWLYFGYSALGYLAAWLESRVVVRRTTRARSNAPSKPA